MLSRTLGRDASALFAVSIDAAAGPCVTVTGGGAAGLVAVTAATAVDACYGAAQYMAVALRASFAWNLTGGSQLANLPSTGPLPAVPPAGLRYCRPANAPYSYYQNVVQMSYSNVWWSFERWQQELDWAALHGINVILAYTGQEALWRTVFQQLGLNESVTSAYFGGPAYLSWSRGQGLQGQGGPLPSWWYASQQLLNQQIVAAMLDLGQIPVLPVFQGNVPPALHYLFPAANMSKDGWLDAFDPLFAQIQDMYMELLAAAYPETSHFYEADGLFTQATGPWLRGELAAPPPDPDAKARSAAVYAGIAKHDPDAIWCYQTWIWRGMGSQQDLEYLDGWLSGVPLGRFFLFDQTAERDPIWASFSNFSFFQQPFVWEAMNNMGGNLGLVGSFDAVTDGVAAAIEGAPSYVGVGFDPEGINQNPAYAEHVYDQAFTGSLQPASAYLADYGSRRCGRDDARVQAAWRLIEATAYRANQSNYEHHMAYCSVAMPLAHDSWNSPVVRPGFGAAPLACAWKLLIDAAPVCAPTHLYDVVDVGREFLSLFPCLAQLDAIVGATALPALATATALMNETLLDLDELLATHRGFLTGAWVADALALGARANASSDDLRLLEWNAKSQISVWHPGAGPGQPPIVTNGLNDYANKQFAGITRDYHLQRYLAFSSVQADAIRAGAPNAPSASEFVALLTPIAQAFASGRTVYPVRRPRARTQACAAETGVCARALPDHSPSPSLSLFLRAGGARRRRARRGHAHVL